MIKNAIEKDIRFKMKTLFAFLQQVKINANKKRIAKQT
jgi:hypothetical protein